MRPLLFLLSLILTLPGIALAAAFLILGSAISTQSWLGFFGVLLHAFVWLLPWGLLAILAAFIALLIAGLGSRFRWLASACVAGLAVGSSIVVGWTTAAHGNFSLEQLPFYIPAAVSAATCAWISIREWPRQP
jgi:hypothetical protein